MAYWSFAEKTFVKQSMMLGVRKIAKKLRFEGGGLNRTRRFEGKIGFLGNLRGKSDFAIGGEGG